MKMLTTTVTGETREIAILKRREIVAKLVSANPDARVEHQNNKIRVLGRKVRISLSV